MTLFIYLSSYNCITIISHNYYALIQITDGQIIILLDENPS